MEKILISVVAKVAEYLVSPIARPIGYVWNYKSNFDNLETEVRKLEGRRQEVEQSVMEGSRQGEETFDHVRGWMARVQNIVDEASEVVRENEQANMKCFKGLCPNPKKRYQHSRKAAKKWEAVAELRGEGNFATVSYPTIPKNNWFPSHKGYEDFESRMSIFEKIKDALSNPEVNMIGIYGTAGIGKSALVRKVAAHAEANKLFNVVAFAEVTMKPDIKEIQQEIADNLGLRFPEGSASGRARNLQQRLMQEKKVFLILDNIWEGLKLEEVGIPYGDDHKGCKVLLTTRNLDVLLKMNSQSNFQIDFLDEREALSLFTKTAGVCSETNVRIQALAVKVAKACGGLPIAVTSVAVALKDKGEYVWINALNELKRPSARSFEGVAAETCACIEISFSQLRSMELKSIFLLCGIMGSTFIEDLLAYGMGLGMFDGTQTIEAARNRVITLTQQLKDSSLLLDASKEKFLMHNAVRNVARSIASRDGQIIVETGNAIPRELIDRHVLRKCNKISLHAINELSLELECPQLEFLYMKSEKELLKVPDKFFTRMPRLKVLHLDGMDLDSVSNSLCCLVNLQTLNIVSCNLHNFHFISELKQLKLLRIRCVDFRELPKEIYNLSELRLLDLNGSESCDPLPFMKSLILKELDKLEKISYYKLKAKSFGQLTSIGIYSCHNLKNIFSFSTNSVLPLLQSVEVDSCDNMEEIFAVGGEGDINNDEETDQIEFKQLRSLILRDLPKLTNVCRMSSNEVCAAKPFFNQKVVFPSVESISIFNMDDWEMIWHNELSVDASCFQHLRSLSIHNCSNLKILFSSSTVALPSLETIEISMMFDLDKIWPDRLCNYSFCNLKSMKVWGCPKLLTIFQSDILERITRLESLKVGSCDLAENIFDLQGIDLEESHPQIEILLRELHIDRLPKLKHIWNKDSRSKFSFQKLEDVQVLNCESLKYLFPISMAKNLAELKKLDVHNCEMEKLVEEMGEAKEAATFVFPQVISLGLSKLPKLKTFYQGEHLSQWPNLKELDLGDVDKMVLFASEFFKFQVNNEGQRDSSVQSSIMVKKDTFPNLEKLVTEGDVKLIVHRHFPEQLCCKIKFLEVTSDKAVVFPLGMLQRFRNLQELRLDCCTYQVLDSYEEAEILDPSVSKFDSKLVTVLHKIQSLSLESCTNLIRLVSSSVSFQNLTFLNVAYCSRLKNLVMSSTAKSLVQLREMKIMYCESMIEVVAKEEDETEDHIIFTKLRTLTLDDLPSLTCFCSGNYTIKLPSLEELNLRNGCPQMQYFSSGDVTTPMLQKVMVGPWWRKEICKLEGDLNTTIQELQHSRKLEGFDAKIQS